MEYRLDCPCGRKVIVSEGSAGTEARCRCGGGVRVPSLVKLRALAGEPPVSPEFALEQLLAAGRLPEADTCAGCGAGTADTLPCWVVCRRAWVRQAGGTSEPCFSLTLLLLLVSPFHGIVHVFREGKTREVKHQEFGKDLIFPLPLRVCPACRATLSEPASVKAALRSIPLYARLLDKYPEAEVSLVRNP